MTDCLILKKYFRPCPWHTKCGPMCAHNAFQQPYLKALHAQYPHLHKPVKAKKQKEIKCMFKI